MLSFQIWENCSEGGRNPLQDTQHSGLSARKNPRTSRPPCPCSRPLYLGHLSPKMSQLPSHIPWILSSPNICSNTTAPELCTETLRWSQTLVLRDPEPNEQTLKLSSGAKRSFSFFPPTFYLCRAWYSVSKEKKPEQLTLKKLYCQYCSVKGQCVTLFLKVGSRSQSAWAAITKCHRLRGSDHRHFFLTILEAEKSKIKVLDDLVPGDSSLAEGCLLAHLPSLCDGQREHWSLFLIHKDINHIMGAPPTLPHLNLLASQRTHHQITSLGLRHINSGESQTFSPWLISLLILVNLDLCLLKKERERERKENLSWSTESSSRWTRDWICAWD